MNLLPQYIEDCSSTRKLEEPRPPHPVLRACAWAFPVLLASVVTCAPVSWGLREWSKKPPPAACVQPIRPTITNTSVLQARP